MMPRDRFGVPAELAKARLGLSGLGIALALSPAPVAVPAVGPAFVTFKMALFAGDAARPDFV